MVSFAFAELAPDQVETPLIPSILDGIAGGMAIILVLGGLMTMAGRLRSDEKVGRTLA